jgi:TRAP-type C4-dicarboxylate transport system substrate-binding protein
MLADCQAGTLDMVACATSAATPFCPDIGILDIPFLYRDIERGRATIDGPVGEEYATLLAAARVPVIAWLENGLRHFTANRPIRTPADLVGLKLRVMPSQSAIDSFRGLGADARPLPYKQLYEALRVGQFEAQENPIVNVETMRLYDVQKYLCLSGHTYGIGVLAASADLAEELTPRQLAALRDCGQAATRVSRAAASEADATGAVRLHQVGMTVIADVDTAAFTKAARANLDMLSRRFTSGRMQRLIEAAG